MENDSMRNFEKRLHKNMKASGMLFPTTDEGVKSFENKFSSVSDPVPNDLSAAHLLSLVNRRSEPLIKLAAFKGRNDNLEVNE